MLPAQPPCLGLPCRAAGRAVDLGCPHAGSYLVRTFSLSRQRQRGYEGDIRRRAGPGRGRAVSQGVHAVAAGRAGPTARRRDHDREARPKAGQAYYIQRKGMLPSASSVGHLEVACLVVNGAALLIVSARLRSAAPIRREGVILSRTSTDQLTCFDGAGCDAVGLGSWQYRVKAVHYRTLPHPVRGPLPSPLQTAGRAE